VLGSRGHKIHGVEINPKAVCVVWSDFDEMPKEMTCGELYTRNAPINDLVD
jgi:hypothetical protein